MIITAFSEMQFFLIKGKIMSETMCNDLHLKVRESNVEQEKKEAIHKLKMLTQNLFILIHIK